MLSWSAFANVPRRYLSTQRFRALHRSTMSQALLQGVKLINAKGESVQGEQLGQDGKVLALYFAADWCPDCRAFQPTLNSFYKAAGDDVDVVFVGSDASAADQLAHFKDKQGPWWMVPFEGETRTQLKRKFGVCAGAEVRALSPITRKGGIPTLVVIHPDGEIVDFHAADKNLPARGEMVEISLECAIEGQVGSFNVTIDDGKKISVLKDAIWEKIKAKFEHDDKFKRVIASDLQLSLAKKGEGWLPIEDLRAIRKGEDVPGFERVSLVDTEDEAYSAYSIQKMLQMKGLPSPQTEQIHVLVAVPPQDDLRSPALTLLEAILPHVLTSAPTTLTDRNKDFKDELCNFYRCYSRKKSCVRCMLLDVAFPNSLVIASHLFRRSNQHVSLVMMQISDIDDVKNGLLLFKPLEHAFDHFQISFIRDDTDTFCLKLFDPSIRDTPLIDLKDRYDNKVMSTEQTELLLRRISSRKKPCRFNVRTTFGDVEGSALTFTGLGRPYNRCLNLQARVALMIAMKKDRIDASYDFKDFWSDVSLDEKMEMFQRSIANSNAEF